MTSQLKEEGSGVLAKGTRQKMRVRSCLEGGGDTETLLEISKHSFPAKSISYIQMNPGIFLKMHLYSTDFSVFYPK